jgi:hypothetical protein
MSSFQGMGMAVPLDGTWRAKDASNTKGRAGNSRDRLARAVDDDMIEVGGCESCGPRYVATLPAAVTESPEILIRQPDRRPKWMERAWMRCPSCFA